MSAAYVWMLLQEDCTGCGICFDVCAFDAIAMPREAPYPAVGASDCTGCMICMEECPFGAIDVRDATAVEACARI